MDILFLRDFRLELIIGIYDWERKVPQTVRLDLEIGMPEHCAGQTDNVADTIDYAAVAGRVRQELTDRRYELVEAVAERVAGVVLDEFKAPWVRVSVTKFAVVRGVKELGVMIERGTRT